MLRKDARKLCKNYIGIFQEIQEMGGIKFYEALEGLETRYKGWMKYSIKRNIREFSDIRQVAINYWKEYGEADFFVQSIWDIIVEAREEALRIKEDGDLQDWHKAAFELFIIADEVVDGLGYVSDDEINDAINKNSENNRREECYKSDSERMVSQPLIDVFQFISSKEQEKEGEQEQKDNNDRKNNDRKSEDKLYSLPSWTKNVNLDVLCVQPKARVSEVGCALRNLSRNLSVLPAIGRVRTAWNRTKVMQESTAHKPLNILIVPFPYEIDATSFSPAKENSAEKEWGQFHLSQYWLECDKLRTHKICIKVDKEGNCNCKVSNLFAKWVMGLINEAEKDSGEINALILPEYSINYEIFKAILEKIKEKEKNIEFVIAGSSDNCDCVKANCVLSAFLNPYAKFSENNRNYLENDQDTGKASLRTVNSQRKHHRWKIDAKQIEMYNLASRLNPNKSWWEVLKIRTREVKFNQFRKDAIFSTLVCEDLARNDPCHSILRAVGPDLVFALLMDGPQLSSRWSGRYASVLSDDPGSTVLSITSYALLNRANVSGEFPENHSIGLLSDSSGRRVEVRCPKGYHGTVITLVPSAAEDKTLDGREAENATRWAYYGQRAVKYQIN